MTHRGWLCALALACLPLHAAAQSGEVGEVGEVSRQVNVNGAALLTEPASAVPPASEPGSPLARASDEAFAGGAAESMPAPIAHPVDSQGDEPAGASAGEPATEVGTEPTTGRGLKPQGTPPAHWPDDLTLSPDRPEPMGLRATPDALPGPSSGLASWYADHFHGRRTASGEPYSRYEMTAAHRDLPLGTLLHVSNPETGVGVVVRVNDRGPFHGDRVIDVSRAAASVLGLVGAGVGQVDLRLPSSEEAAEFARRLAQAAMRPAVAHPRTAGAAPVARSVARPSVRPTARSVAPLARQPLR